MPLSQFAYLRISRNSTITTLDLPNQTTVTCNLRNGLRYAIRNRTADFRILREVWISNDYQFHGFEIGPCDTVVDIGAQIGVFTVQAAAAARQGRVLSFEPFRENYELLTSNIALNGLKHVTPINKAIAARAETRELHISSVNTGGHSLYGAESPGRIVRVETTTLQGLMETYDVENIDFLKMDCEGAETEIFETCPIETLTHIKKMVIETHERDHPSGLAWIKRLEDNGFSTQMRDNLLCVTRKS